MATTVVLALFAGRAIVSSQEPQAPTDGPTFRVGTRLATIDAVVVDDKGQHVTDLRPEDFEVVERGKKQAVRQALYVQVIGPDGRPVPQPTLGGAAAPDTPGPAAETARARPLAGGSGLASATRSGRVLAIVVDDLGLSHESTAYVRQMLNRYVDTKVAPGDLVAIIRTAGGVGTLQQFTTDRRLLHAAIDRVRYSLQSRSGVAAFDAVVPASSTALVSGKGLPIDDLREEMATAGTLGALEYVLRGIEALPGRKSVVFVSEGFNLGVRDAKVSRTWQAFTRVMDRANRAGVVVYSMDARGLQTTGMSAEDDPQTPKMSMPGSTGTSGADIRETITNAGRDRRKDLFDSQDSLVYLAQQTGGFAVLNTNDLTAGMMRVVDDTRGYYLLGFDTSIPVNDRWDPNDIHIRITRPGLTVRARRGLFGPAEKDRARDTAPADPLVAATLSPFSTGAIDVRLTTLFAHDGKAGSYVRSLFFIDPAGLTFVDGADGRKEADLSMLLMAIGDNGQPVGQLRLQVPLRLDEDAYRLLRQRGLLYSARLPIKDAGGYQIRAAVQDDRSKAIGSGAQFVEVPQVGKDRVALSGVVMMDVAVGGPNAAGVAPTALATDAIADGVLGEPAIKIFRPGTEVAYTFEIYDGRGKRKEGFSTQATLLRDGKAFYTTPPSPVGAAPESAKPIGAVPVGGKLSLGRGLPRGTYTLQVSVAPQSGRDRNRQASQWVDFEVR
ncbi:MAG: VWA domain-containing protein [Vicinamibacteraceae bacterium]